MLNGYNLIYVLKSFWLCVGNNSSRRGNVVIETSLNIITVASARGDGGLDYSSKRRAAEK